MNDIDLTAWLQQTQDRRTKLLKYSLSGMAWDASSRSSAMDELLQAEADAASLRADVEGFLVAAEAQAVLAVREKYPDLTAQERRAQVKNEIRDVVRLVEGLGIIVRTLSSRRFLQMNANRAIS